MNETGTVSSTGYELLREYTKLQKLRCYPMITIITNKGREKKWDILSLVQILETGTLKCRYKECSSLELNFKSSKTLPFLKWRHMKTIWNLLFFFFYLEIKGCEETIIWSTSAICCAIKQHRASDKKLSEGIPALKLNARNPHQSAQGLDTCPVRDRIHL